MASGEVERDGKVLRIYFPYNPKIVEVLRGLPGREFKDHPVKHWTLPAHPWHARQMVSVLGTLGFHFSDEVLALATDAEKKDAETQSVRGRSLPGLKPGQEDAVAFALAHEGRVIIADDVGYGKTWEALGYAARMGLERILTVTQASVLYKWQDEFKHVMEMDVPVVGSYGEAWPTSPSHITSYSVLTRRPEALNQEYDLFIIDEAHLIKNHKSQRTKKALLVGNGIPHILPLTATPFPNRPQEIWNLLHLLDPVAWKNIYDFLRRYCGGYMIEGVMTTAGPTNQAELEERLRSIMIRRLKTRNDYTFRRVFLPIDLPNMAFYRQVKAEVAAALAQLNPESPGYFQNALAKLTALRQVVGIGKAFLGLAWAKNFLEESEGKLVVYAHHKAVVLAMVHGLSEYTVDIITGATPNQKRDDIRRAFQEDDDPRVLVLSEAGGVGIDLFGRNGHDCSNLLIVERQWAPYLEEQVEGRLDREGQTRPVTAWYLLGRGTVDIKLHNFVEKKRQMVSQLIPTEDVATEFLESVINDLLTGRETEV